MAVSRRTMFRGTAGAAVTAGALTAMGTAASAEPHGWHGHAGVPVDKISIQLYTLRDLFEADLEGTMSALADIGYRQVETAGTYGRTAAEFRKVLDANHISATSAHNGIENLDQAIADAKALGNKRVNVAFADFETLAEWQEFAGKLDAAGQAYRDAGIEFGYHNHSHEFELVEGVRPYDVLTKGTSRRNVQFEVDLFWAITAKVDPVDLFWSLPGRVTQYHVKDMNADGGMVDPGEGVIDFPDIFWATRPLEVTEYIVENDEPVDALKCAKTGFDYLSTLEF